MAKQGCPGLATALPPAAAATTTIAATASALVDAAGVAANSAIAATGHHPRPSTAGHWPSPPITAGAAFSIFTDALAAGSTAAFTAHLPAEAQQVC